MDLIVLLLFIVFGIIIILGYVNVLPKQGDKIWNNVREKNLRTFYKVMVSLSFLAGAYLVYFFTTHNNNYKILLYTGLSFLLFFSSIWAWKPFYHNKLILFLVSIGSFLLLINTSMEFNKSINIKIIVALMSCLILFIQTFIFDFFIWNGIK